MDALLTAAPRWAAVVVLVAVMASSVVAICHLARAGWPWSPAVPLRVLPFDLVQGSGVAKGQGDVIARQLSATVNRIVRVLNALLTRRSGTPPPSTRAFGPRTVPRCQVTSPLVLGIPYVKFDLTGMQESLAGLTYGGYTLSGTVRIGEKEVELLADAVYRGGEKDRDVGPWAVRGARLADGVEDLAYRVVFDVWLAREPGWAPLGPEGVRFLATAIEQYLRVDSCPAGFGALHSRLAKAVTELGAFTRSTAPVPVLYACLVVFHDALEWPQEARRAAELLGRIDPTHPFIQAAQAEVGAPAQLPA